MRHDSRSLLDPAAADAFIAGYKKVLLAVADAARLNDGKLLDRLVQARARIGADAALREKSCVEARKDSPAVEDPVLQAIATLRLGDWVYLKDTKRHSVFVEASGNFGFGVLSLTQPIRDIVGATGVVIETGVVRYRGHYVCDGLVSRVVHLGPNYRKSFLVTYQNLRLQGRFDVGDEANSLERSV